MKKNKRICTGKWKRTKGHVQVNEKELTFTCPFVLFHLPLHVLLFFFIYLYMSFCSFSFTCTYPFVLFHLPVHILLFFFIYLHMSFCKRTKGHVQVNEKEQKDMYRQMKKNKRTCTGKWKRTKGHVQVNEKEQNDMYR
jgi:amino acid permease